MLPNSFIKKFSWVLLFSMLFSLFSVFPEEPAYAAGEFSCFNSDGKAYAYQSVWDSTHLDVYRWEATTGQTAANDGNATLVAIFTASDFSPHHGDISEVNSFMMDRDGNAYAILKEDDSDNSAHLFKLNMPSSGTDGTATDMGQISDGDNNAGTYYENNGHKYLITSNGFMKGNNVAIRLNSDGSTTQISINRTGESGTSKAKDFTWLPNANFSGLSDGVSPDIIGFDRKNTKVYYGYISHTNQGASDEGVTVNVQSQSVSTPSGWSGSGNAAGAVFGFGKDEIYAINNNTGQLYSIDYSSGFSLSEAQFSSQDLYANNTTNNDGAACHEGSATVDWDPTLTAAQGTCDGSNRGIAVTLNNSSGGIAATYSVSYTVNGGGSNTLEAAEVVAAGNTTILNIPAQSDDAEIDILWSAANTDYLNNTPDSGTTTVEITVDTSSCANGTVSTGLGTCSNGAATSTITLTATNGTVHFDVQYSTNGGSNWTDLKDGEAVSPGSPETYATPAQADGTTVSWQFRWGTSNPSSGSFINTNATSRTIDCDPNSTVSQAITCSGDTATSTLSITNNESDTAYYKVEYQIDTDSFEELKGASDDLAVSAGATDTSLSRTVAEGSTITWRITDSFTDGNYTNMSAETISQSSPANCVVDSTGSQTLAESCANGAKTSTFSIRNNESSTAYYEIEYRIDSGSWVEADDNLEVSANTTNTSLTASVPDGSSIDWRFKSSFTNNDFSGKSDETGETNTNLDSSTVDCDPNSTVSQELTCSGGSATSTLSIRNNEESDTAYYKVDYRIDSGSWVEVKTASDDLEVSAGATNTSLSQSVSEGSTITWRITDSFTDGNYTNQVVENVNVSSSASCTTTTTTSTTTTTLPKEVFKPVIKNNRTCNEGGGGNFGLSIDHRDSTVDAIIKLSVYIDKKIVSETTYKISSGTSAFITTIENVPEDSKYKLLISVKNTLNNKEASGKFVKKANCIKDADETTTTIPKLTTTTSISPTTTIDTDFDIDVDVGITTTSTTTTTIPPPTTTIPIDPDEGDPLTSEEGNDIYVWDFEEDIYFTDGDFIVTYLYQENSITMADTGLNLTFINYEELDPNYLYYGSVTSFLLGIGFFIRYRKRRLLNKTSSLQKVYENASTLKEALESIVQTKVKITFDNDEKYNPENKKLKQYSHLVKELQYTTVAIQNIKKKDIFGDIYRSVIIKILQDNLTSLNNAGFTIIFSDEQALLDKKTSSVTEITSRKNKLKKKKVKRNGFLIAASFTMMSFIIGFYAFQQTFLTNTQQIAAQEELKEIFTNESPVEEIYERKFNLNLDFSNDENEAGLFPEIREIFNLRSNTTKEVEDASVFGFLEIPEINLEQYVVIGTSEAELQLGPGYYLGTEIPGSGGNVGIAGHRTTHGAPFGDLHLVNVGDAINLTFAGNKYQYIIDQIHVVPARGGEYLLYNNGVDRLTLTTCHPRYSGKERLVVSGILKKIQSSA